LPFPVSNIINCMEPANLLVEHLTDAMLNVIFALYHSGIREVHVGALMRLLGVPNLIAAEHDNEKVVIDEDFKNVIDQLRDNLSAELKPGNTTYH